MSRSSLLASATVPMRIVLLMWLVFFLGKFGWDLSFGIIPREPFGLIGIFTAPLVHSGVAHLISNTFPLLFLGTVLYFFYERIGTIVFIRGYFWTNILVWLFAHRVNHIGASGLVYALAFFLIFYGIFKRDFTSLLISIVVCLLYGGIFYGIFPGNPIVSWESHFAGALVGISTAVTFSSKKKE
jgi:membrane associated rhomboid family serine protease